MNSQKYNKEELYPEDFTEKDKLKFDMFFNKVNYYFLN